MKVAKKSTRQAESAGAVQSPLKDLCGLDEFQTENAHLFPSRESLNWYIRTNRDELTRAAAVLEIAGRQIVHRERLAQKVVEIGARKARRREHQKEAA